MSDFTTIKNNNSSTSTYERNVWTVPSSGHDTGACSGGQLGGEKKYKKKYF